MITKYKKEFYIIYLVPKVKGIYLIWILQSRIDIESKMHNTASILWGLLYDINNYYKMQTIKFSLQDHGGIRVAIENH